MDETTTLTIKGKPYTHYTIVIEDTMDGSRNSRSPATTTSTSTNTTRPSTPTERTVSVPLYLPTTTGDSSHTTRSYYPKIYETRNPSTSTTVQVMVEPGGSTKEIVLDDSKLSDDEYYCLGDAIHVTGRLGKPAPDEMDIYFYITGPNLGSNGAKPSNPGFRSSTATPAHSTPFTSPRARRSLSSGGKPGTPRLPPAPTPSLPP